MNPTQLTKLIKRRRSIFPASYIDKPIDKAILEEILENANWAPNHRHTAPWRFKVFQGEALNELSTYLSTWYRENTSAEQFSEKKFQKNQRKPLQSACVIAICMQRDPRESVPEWEEIAAVACAVQNMWLTCTVHGIGSYWSSPRSMIEAVDFLHLAEGERCLGLFYMGYHEMPELPGKRESIADKIVWR